jgi:creatinine amidohydrolase/Fe(II)-dependent formamide hydrolase-like protein
MNACCSSQPEPDLPGKMLMQLVEATWKEVEAYLTTSKAIVVPIGSVEQHGPLGLIGTDAMCAEIISHRAGEIGGFLTGPTLPIGMAQSHLAFPGTISLKPSTLMAVIRDVVSSLSGAGFEHIIFLNGHGGNIATAMAAFGEINAERSLQPDPVPLNLQFKSWFDLPGIRDLLSKMYPKGHGSHATPSEIAITQHMLPHTIKQAVLDPQIAPDGGFSDAHDFRKRYPDGRKGADSSLAKPEDGAKLIEAAAQALATHMAGLHKV